MKQHHELAMLEAPQGSMSRSALHEMSATLHRHPKTEYVLPPPFVVFRSFHYLRSSTSPGLSAQESRSMLLRLMLSVQFYPW